VQRVSRLNEWIACKRRRKETVRPSETLITVTDQPGEMLQHSCRRSLNQQYTHQVWRRCRRARLQGSPAGPSTARMQDQRQAVASLARAGSLRQPIGCPAR
jgi:hypothetical protein